MFLGTYTASLPPFPVRPLGVLSGHFQCRLGSGPCPFASIYAVALQKTPTKLGPTAAETQANREPRAPAAPLGAPLARASLLSSQRRAARVAAPWRRPRTERTAAHMGSSGASLMAARSLARRCGPFARSDGPPRRHCCWGPCRGACRRGGAASSCCSRAWCSASSRIFCWYRSSSLRGPARMACEWGWGAPAAELGAGAARRARLPQQSAPHARSQDSATGQAWSLVRGGQ
jgi:hypothetical protein